MDSRVTDTTIQRASSSRDAPTEYFDAVECLSSRDIHKAVVGDEVAPGSYLLVSGTSQALLIPLDGSKAHIGRGLHADLSLDDDSVSRRHAIIIRAGEQHEILDDRSLNGTYVNGQEITRSELHDEDVIRLGRVELTYRVI